MSSRTDARGPPRRGSGGSSRGTALAFRRRTGALPARPHQALLPARVRDDAEPPQDRAHAPGRLSDSGTGSAAARPGTTPVPPGGPSPAPLVAAVRAEAEPR
ncbi:hypothetical protein ACQYWQ_29780 [Streptomyces sp. P6-2-1]|uniref:hypothetical protein n=1 Tax=Streptomyces sp. P6-2-1 TaxID=3422591 RepID=UPI003D360133